MSKIFQSFIDKAKTIKGYPKTLTKAVYDDNGNRLDNVLSELNTNFNDLNKAKEINFYGTGVYFQNVELNLHLYKMMSSQTAVNNHVVVYGGSYSIKYFDVSRSWIKIATVSDNLFTSGIIFDCNIMDENMNNVQKALIKIDTDKNVYLYILDDLKSNDYNFLRISTFLLAD